MANKKQVPSDTLVLFAEAPNEILPKAPDELREAARPPMLEFSKWVSFARVALDSHHSFATESSPTAKPDPAIASAWSELKTSAMLASRLLELGHATGSNHYNYHSSHWARRAHPDEALCAAIAPLGIAQARIVAAGLRALAAKTRSALGEKAFQEAAKAASKLFASPSSADSISYPTLGLALAEGFTMVEGKRQKTLAGKEIMFSFYGNALNAPNAENNQGIQRELAARMGAEAAGDEQLERSAKEEAPLASESTLSPTFGFFAQARPNGDTIIAGEARLPSVKALRSGFAKESKPDGVFLSDQAREDLDAASKEHRENRLDNRAKWVDVKVEGAARLARSSWRAALASAISEPEKKGLTAERFSRMDLRAGSRGFFKLPAEETLHGRFHNVDQAASAEIVACAKALGIADRDIEAERSHEMPHSFSQPFATHVIAQTSVWSHNKKAKPTDFADALWQCIEGQAMCGLATREYRNAGYGHGHRRVPEPSSPMRSKATQTAKDRLAAIKKASDATPAEIGLAQWALSLGSSIDQARKSKEELDDASKKLVVDRNAAKDDPVRIAKEDFVSALADFCLAADEFRLSFQNASLDAASAAETAWLEAKGYARAWEQASLSGELSPRSLGWASANPAGESMASQDPMLRLAARAARSMGLDPKAGSDKLLADFHAELAEMGASAEGIALMSTSPELQETLASLAALATGADKKAARTARSCLKFFASGISGAASLGIPALEASDFFKSYFERLPDANYWEQARAPFSLFACAVQGNDGRFDGLCPELAASTIGNKDSARLYAELSRSKSDGYGELVSALASDWHATMSGAVALGAQRKSAIGLAEARANEIRVAFPSGAAIDWRRRPFKAKSAWEVFDMPSPRFTAAADDAAKNCSEVGKWCSERARALGIHDAADGNDLVGKTRDQIKSRLGLSDAGWKLAIKQPKALASIASALGLAPGGVSRHPSILDEALLNEAKDGPLPRRNSQTDTDNASMDSDFAKTAGMALTTAAARNLDPFLAAETLEAIQEGGMNRKRYDLLSEAIRPMLAQSHHEAEFFIQECDAKAARQAKVFTEACKRFEKHKADEAKAVAFHATHKDEIAKDLLPDTRFKAAARFREELDDLGDWIGGSEHGLWAQIPLETTFGQLSRQSKAWHDEQAAMAADKADRARVRQAVAEAVAEADASKNPFAVHAGSRWAKIIGKHSRDGWEAVELLSAADLTEEGAAMRHCVSLYSSYCRQGDSRIFSIRLNGERKCTLEIRPSKKLSGLDEHDRFSIVQNKGVANQSVSHQATLDFCLETLTKVQETWPKIVGRVKAARDDNKEAKKIAQQAKEKVLQELMAEKAASNDAPKIPKKK